MRGAIGWVGTNDLGTKICGQLVFSVSKRPVFSESGILNKDDNLTSMTEEQKGREREEGG